MLSVITLQASAQTADEIASKYVEASGGKEKLASLKTVRMSGSMETNGTEISITSSKKHEVGIRVDLDIMGTSNYQLINTKGGWMFFPVMGMTDPKEMEPALLKAAINQLDVQGALFNYKEKGIQVESLGKEMVEGAEAFKLKLTFKNGYTSNYFIDTKTYHHIKTTAMANVNGQEVEASTSFGDYKLNADGYLFPYSTTTMQGTINFDKIESNVALDDKLFEN